MATTTSSLSSFVSDGSSPSRTHDTTKAIDATTANGQENQDTDTKPPMWFLWLGDKPMNAFHRAAVDSCKHTNHDAFDVRVVSDGDVHNAQESLGFALHPAFHLLDPVQKSDYLRIELLHHHGGIYFDTDLFCLRPLKTYLEKLDPAKGVVGAGSPTGESDVNNSNMLGPFLSNSTFTLSFHEALWKKMDDVMPVLEQCAVDHPDGKGGVAYDDDSPTTGPQTVCGTTWGELIDHLEQQTFEAYQMGTIVPSFQKCGPESPSEAAWCDVLSVDCSKMGRVCETDGIPCDRYRVLQGADHIACN